MMLTGIILGIWMCGLVGADVAPTPDLNPPSPTDGSVSVDPSSPPARRLTPEEIVAAFVESIAQDEEFEESARRFVVDTHQNASDADRPDFIHSAFAVLSDGFRIGFDRLNADDPRGAAEVFEALAADRNPYLAVAAANFAGAALLDIEDLDRAERILTEVEKSWAPVDRFTLEAGRFTFQLGYAQIHTLQYDAAERTLTRFLANYPRAPQRLRVTATQILTELQRRTAGRIGDVRDLMKYASRNLTLGETGERVIRRQEEAVELLAALIEEAQQREKAGGQGGGSGQSNAPGSSAGGQQPASGARQSSLPGGESRIGELRKRTARPGEAWGRMPPRERAEILQSLQRQFPSRYRELLEQYYQQLARESSDH